MPQRLDDIPGIAPHTVWFDVCVRTKAGVEEVHRVGVPNTHKHPKEEAARIQEALGYRVLWVQPWKLDRNEVELAILAAQMRREAKQKEVK